MPQGECPGVRNAWPVQESRRAVALEGYELHGAGAACPGVACIIIFYVKVRDASAV